MTVYVQKLRYPGRALLGRVAPPDPWFSLTADTEDELRGMTARTPASPNRSRHDPHGCG
jgi:hypothetical protein